MNEKQKRQPFTFWIFSPSFELSAESVTLSVIRNTYLRAHKAAGPPSSTSLRVKLRRVERLRRAKQRLSHASCATFPEG
jgi:hypothetical protein